ncbi:MAG TPA: metallophosphoesterase [Ktedonobacteraceae bacterium]|nr:metallophosphoesterase [Ktedonobacteraceae bacterium]
MDQQHTFSTLSGNIGSTTGRDEGIIRVILTADNHLSAYSPKLSPTKLAERRRRLGLAFKQVVDAAIERRAHLFIQAGDLFDSVDPRNRERDFVAEQLKRLQSAGIHTFGVSGNHDTPRQKTEQGGFAPQNVYHRLNGMYYFASSDVLTPVELDVAGLRLALAGLSYHPGVVPGGDPLDHVQIVDSDNVLTRSDLGILILHAAIEGHAFPGEKETFVRRSSLARFEGFRVVLAGHVHAYDRFSIGDKAVVVCGATERMEFGQSEDKTGFVYLELTRKGLHHAEQIPIKPQPRDVITIRTTELWPQQQLNTATPLNPSFMQESEVPVLSITERIIQKIDSYCTEEAMVRLNLEGPITREQYHLLDLRGIWLYGQQRAFSFEIDESRLILINDLSQARVERGERIAPREMLEAIAQEWMEKTETPDRRAILTKTRQRVLDRYDELSGRETDQ